MLAAALVFAAPVAQAASLPSTNVAWQAAAADADIDRAFARARAEGKPVLLYWGATWCPPCNQLKATLFARQEFAALAKGFIAVHVDGDRPGAQKLGSRFKVSGYPTTVLFTPDGQEVTRLPGEVDAPQALAVLQLGLAGGRPVKRVLADALAGRALTAAEWRLLAFYSWETDEQQLVPKAELPHVLARLAVAGEPAVNGTTGTAATPAPASASAPAGAEIATRLWLKALAASDDGKGLKADDALRQRVSRVLAEPREARAQMDVLTNGAADIVRTLEDEDSPRRAPLVAAYDAAMQRLATDTTLSRADRLGAWIARIDLARLADGGDAVHPKLPAPLLAGLREHVARADREITDGYERQAVITAAAYALGRAGLWADSDALLQANLAKSHSPYYLMSQLGSNARKLGKKDEALRWYGEAFDKATGPATRLQWGSGYLSALVDLAPQDAARIERVAAQLLREAAADAGAFEGRSVRSLQRVGNKLAAWNGEGRHAAAMKRLQAQLDGVCAGLVREKSDATPGQRQACERLLKPSPSKTAQLLHRLLTQKAA
ncbi:MAG: thioredoxin family protein [Betaproteobacteria bacterium]|nr:thioredoxin family protein [Betaproteobacteria bacterium]MCC6247204.1 thioredoxin family protein [Rubrivivax sp.]